MVNNLNQNFEMLRQIQQRMRRNQAGPSRQRDSSLKCKACGANESKFFNNNNSGDLVCTNCGVIQSERRLVQHNDRVKNGEVLYARVIVEEEQKIKLLVNLFFNVLFG
mgnify:CR=1 FL=1